MSTGRCSRTKESGIINQRRLEVLLICTLLIVMPVGFTVANCSAALITVRFAAISDYGVAGTNEQGVSNLVKSWSPDLVITAGDNNCPSGAASTIDQNIGQYYHSFIYPYKGGYGPGSDTNRFFPSLGNHDWGTPGVTPYLDYFTLPGNERYYDFTWGPVHFYALDSDTNEPDGYTSTSTQASWLQSRMAASTEPWKIVYFHHAAYSSGSLHGSTTYMQWPFQQWGATAVISGHDHHYERLMVSGLTYFVIGLGGQGIRGYGTILPESQVRYNGDYGAMLVQADTSNINFKFYSQTGSLVDDYTISSSLPQTPSNLAASSASSTQISLAWTDNANNEDGFKIERASSSTGPWGQIATVGPNVVSYSDANLSPSTTYYYHVCAYNSAGNSGYSNTASATTNAPSDFSISASPASLTIQQGSFGSSTITVTSLSGFSSVVSLSVSGCPAGATYTLSPTSVTPPPGGSATSELSINAGSAAVNTYALSITGASGSLTHSTPVSLTVTAAPPPDFSLSLSPSSLNIKKGRSGASAITVTSSNGFSSAVSLSVSGAPTSMICTLSASSVTPSSGGSAASELTIAVGPSTAAGTYTIKITGTSGALTHTANLTLRVSGGPKK